VLPAPIPEGFAQTAQMTGAPDDVPALGSQTPPLQGGGLVDKVKDTLS